MRLRSRALCRFSSKQSAAFSFFTMDGTQLLLFNWYGLRCIEQRSFFSTGPFQANNFHGRNHRQRRRMNFVSTLDSGGSSLLLSKTIQWSDAHSRFTSGSIQPRYARREIWRTSAVGPSKFILRPGTCGYRRCFHDRCRPDCQLFLYQNDMENILKNDILASS